MSKVNRKSDEYKSVFGSNPKVDGSITEGSDWGSVPPDILLGLVTAVTSRGGACRFGYSRDGQAASLGLYYGSESVTKYCRPAEDLGTFCQVWTEFYLKLPDTKGVSPAQ